MNLGIYKHDKPIDMLNIYHVFTIVQFNFFFQSWINSQDGTVMSILQEQIPRSRGCRYGKCALHSRDGGLCAPAGVQQHRGHDSAQ